jgi:hypothetical protein
MLQKIFAFLVGRKTPLENGASIRILTASKAGLVNIKDIFLHFARWHQGSGMRESMVDENVLEAEGAEPKAKSRRKQSPVNAPCELDISYPLINAAVHFRDLICSKGPGSEPHDPFEKGRVKTVVRKRSSIWTLLPAI